MKKKLFVYGTLKKGQENHHFLENRSRLLDNSYKLEDYACYHFLNKLYFAVEEKGSYIIGELYEIEEDIVKELDLLEGVETGIYKKVNKDDFFFYVAGDNINVKYLKKV